MRARLDAQNTAIEQTTELLLRFQLLNVLVSHEVEMNIGLLQTFQILSITIFIDRPAFITFFNTTQIECLATICQVVHSIIYVAF